MQVEGRIDQDPTISSQFTLWSQSGSKVIRGNMLVIPIGGSNLYVEPIYLQAQNGPIPELKRVVVSTGNRVVMEPTLEEALNRLFGVTVATGPAGTPSPAAAATTGQATAQQPAAQSAPGVTVTPDAAALIRSANDHFTRAQEALKAGDWARYGDEQRALQADLQRLAEITR